MGTTAFQDRLERLLTNMKVGPEVWGFEGVRVVWVGFSEKIWKVRRMGVFLERLGMVSVEQFFISKPMLFGQLVFFFGMIVWLFVCQKRANRVILLVETAMSLQPNQFNPFAKQCSTFKRHLKVPALLQPTLPPWHAGGDTKASRPWSCQVRVTSKFRLWWQMLGSYAPG